MNFAEKTEYLRYESNIVWLMDIEKIEYVRETIAQGISRRKGLIKYADFVVVGYSELTKDAPNTGYPGNFRRRIFWLKEYDRYLQPNDVYKANSPAEGVDPLTIAPRVPGKKTERAWGVQHKK